MYTAQQYVPVIGIAHFWSLCALLEKLELLEDKTVNEVQTSVPHNGYATAIVTLSVFLIESVVGRAQYLKNIVPPMNPIDYLKQAPSASDLADDIEELFVVRDIIAHNHLWDAEITTDQGGALRITSARLRNGYGDKKFRRVVNIETRRTRRLGLNAFSTRIWYNDAVIALKKLSLCLNHLDQQDERVLRFKEWPVTYRGVPLMFTDLVDSLEALLETG